MRKSSTHKRRQTWLSQKRVAALNKSRMTTRSQVGDELQFADAYGHPIEPLSGICVLAMHFRPGASDSDTERIQSMLTNLNVDGVLSAGWGVDKYPGFAPCDFKSFIPQNVAAACHNFARVVCLDYFYLPAHYYFENYGSNWVSQKIQTLLQGVVECVILPYDRLGEERGSKGGLAETGSLLEQIRISLGAPIPYFNLSWAQAEKFHPLVKASGEDFLPLVTSRTGKHVNTSARYNYLSSGRSFAVFHKGDEGATKILLANMCQLRTGSRRGS